jgi:hypothetical protein
MSQEYTTPETEEIPDTTVLYLLVFGVESRLVVLNSLLWTGKRVG